VADSGIPSAIAVTITEPEFNSPCAHSKQPPRPRAAWRLFAFQKTLEFHAAETGHSAASSHSVAIRRQPMDFRDGFRDSTKARECGNHAMADHHSVD
jgi:hypothetical protein